MSTCLTMACGWLPACMTLSHLPVLQRRPLRAQREVCLQGRRGDTHAGWREPPPARKLVAKQHPRRLQCALCHDPRLVAPDPTLPSPSPSCCRPYEFGEWWPECVW